jgi:hypothetical protein
MKNYLVQITVQLPYPKKIDIKVSGSGFGTAASRGIREAKKQFKGCHLKEMIIKIIQL